nr:hypothetical protein HAGR004_10540 [Bdellovibrio sp. HAGR004]
MTMKTTMKLVSTATILAMTLTASFAFARDTMPPKAPTVNWSNLQRENMAKMHEDMAKCLRTSKSPSECQADMRMACKNMGENACPMMGKKGHHMMMYEE